MSLILDAVVAITFIGVMVSDYQLSKKLDYLIELLERR